MYNLITQLYILIKAMYIAMCDRGIMHTQSVWMQ